MIGTSTTEYIFIRCCILFLHWITPLSILYCIAPFIIRIPPYHGLWILQAFTTAEAAFYFLVYLPRKRYLQAPAIHPTALPRDERYRLFRNCFENIPDPQNYLSKWFLDAPISDIKRDNIKDFLRWAFLNGEEPQGGDDQELEGYVNEFETLLGVKFSRGRGPAKCLSLTINPVDMMRRSLAWYLCVGFVDILTYVKMLLHSFHFHRTSVLQTLAIFPPRPLALMTSHLSPVKTLSYWHRLHTSKTKLPILFIHGIGIGLYPYVKFLAELNPKDWLDSDDGVGIIAVELMPVSFRITHAALEKDQICDEIRQIVAKHGWREFVLVSHSYGSVISSHLLHNPQVAKQIKAVVLIDPITFLLHMPDVAYNFTYRKPIRANEHQLYYFASMDMGVSHTLSRRFFWFENIMWKHDIKGWPVTVSLGGKDLIVDTSMVRNYLIGNKTGPGSEQYQWKERECQGLALNVLWFKDLDHAQVFDKKKTRNQLVDVIRTYCSLR